MKKNNELDFNFDNTPFKPAQKPAARNVDRTAKRPTAAAQAPAESAKGAYRWGSAPAPSNMLTPDEIMHLNDTPAARGNFAAEAKKADSVKSEPKISADTAPEKIPMAPAKREIPSAKAEPTASDTGFSSAALEIMRRMQRTEGIKAADVHNPEIKKAAPVEEKAEAAQAEIKAKPDDIAVGVEVSELPKKPVENGPAISKPVANKTAEHISDESEVAAVREARADSFELDQTAMAEGMQELELEMTQTFDAADGQTRMFAPVVDTAQAAPADGATRYIDVADAVDELYSEDEYEDEETYIDEYNSVDDAQSVARDLISRKRRLGIRTVFTAVITALLLIITLCADSGTLFPFGQPPYFIAVGVLLGLAVIANISTFASLISVFTLKPDIDFAPAFAMLAVSIQTAVAAFTGTEGMLHTSIFAAAATLSLTAGTFAKRLIVGRTLANFELIANEEIKQSGGFIAPPQSEYIADKSKLGETLIFGRRDAIDLKGFIAYSLSPDFYEKQSGRMSFVALIASIISLLAILLTGGSVGSAVSMFAATACAAAQIAFIHPCAVQLSRSCRRLRQNKVMLSGIKAADEISEANVIVLDSDELFFDDCVNLYKFRTFGDCPPDEAFMTAYALAMGGHSPLAGMFGKVCQTQNCGMYKADSIVYENSMGITGWVNERKTLLGNRMIMESHTIPVPSMEVDRKILQSGKFPVYLAIDNKIAALFIVGYEPDRGMLHRVRRLINTGVTVLVRTVDPNVTADLVCDKYGLPSDSVMIMESNASHIYCNHMQPADSAPALASAPNAEGFVDAYIESYAISRRNKIASIAVIVMSCIMMALTIIMPLLGLSGTINLLTTLISHAVTLVFAMIIMAFLG